MSQLINLPIVIKGSTVKGGWQLAGAVNGIPLVEQHSFVEDRPRDGVIEWLDDEHPIYRYFSDEDFAERAKASRREFQDPWNLFSEFSGVKSTGQLLDFLNATGHFCDPRHTLNSDITFQFESGEVRYAVTNFWCVQRLLAEMLLNRKPVIDAPRDSVPLRWIEAFDEGFRFKIGRRLGEYVAEVRTHDTLTTLVAVAQCEILKAGKFRACKRPDCGRLFEVEKRGRSKNEYCSHTCAHTAWQRRKRGTRAAVEDERLPLGYGVYKKARKRPVN